MLREPESYEMWDVRCEEFCFGILGFRYLGIFHGSDIWLMNCRTWLRK